jgi:hypothetical protein
MADEINLHYIDQAPPDQVMQAWRAQPPAFLEAGRFDLVDDSYNSLSYEARFYDWPAKLMFVATFGVGYLMRGFMESLWKLTVRFDADGEYRTRVTVIGQADQSTRAALGELAAAHGGSVGLRVGV